MRRPASTFTADRNRVPDMATHRNDEKATGVSPSHRWWTIRDIAEDLNISIDTAYKWSARGQPTFPRAIRLANGDIRVRYDWYETWLDDLESR